MKPNILLIGGGGHCKSCIDVIEQEGVFEIAGIIEKNPNGKSVLSYPILGCDDDLGRLRGFYQYALITLGQIKTPAIRIRLFDLLKSLGFETPSIVSPRAYVSKHSTIEEGTIIMHDVCVNANARVGKNCIINSKALIEHDVCIEDHCHISTAAVVNGGTTIKTGTFIGSNAITKENVTTHYNDFIKASALFKGYGHG